VTRNHGDAANAEYPRRKADRLYHLQAILFGQHLCARCLCGSPLLYLLHNMQTPRWHHRREVLAAALLLVISFAPSCHSGTNSTSRDDELTVAAAADVAPAFEEIGRAFEQQHHVKVVFSFGSTGMLTQQIENGAPMDLFAAASVEYIDRLDKEGLIIPGTKALYGRGRITLWTARESNLNVQEIADLTRSEIKRIAIANPEHAPYGVAAREALQKANVWDAVKSKLVFGENIRQTLQYAQTGNADVAIVALSLSIQSDGHWVLVPEELHQPLDQALGVIKGTKHESQARSFADFIKIPPGQEVLRKYGFRARAGEGAGAGAGTAAVNPQNQTQ